MHTNSKQPAFTQWCIKQCYILYINETYAQKMTSGNVWGQSDVANIHINANGWNNITTIIIKYIHHNMTQGGFGDTISSQLKHHLLSVLSNATRDDLITPKSWVKVAEVPTRYIWKHPTRKQQVLACSFGGRGQDYVTNQSTETSVVCPVKCHQGWQSLFSQPGTLSCKINQTCMWGSCLAWNNKNKHLHPSCAGQALDYSPGKDWPYSPSSMSSQATTWRSGASVVMSITA